MWDEWEDLTEEEIESCFKALEGKSIYSCAVDGCNEEFSSLHSLKTHSKCHSIYNPGRMGDSDAQAIYQQAVLMAAKCDLQVQPEASPDVLTVIKSLVKRLYELDGNRDRFYSEYTETGRFASKHLNMPQMEAALLLIKLFDAVAKGKEEQMNLPTAGVDSRETDILEYIGGYLLRKVCVKHGDCAIKHLSAAEPCGNFMKNIEIKRSCLQYPSPDFLGVLIRIYCFHNKETAKTPKDINLLRLHSKIEEDVHVNNFIKAVCAKSGLDSDYIQGIMSEIWYLFLKVLGHNFARFTLQKSQTSSSKFSSSLRKSLSVSKK